ncbi:MAG: hypothetical protein LBG77_07845 [Dysgonamonadaceae bacterium]|nr:hypothetical protein [Dysgonamonadaceae bacterium]
MSGYKNHTKAIEAATDNPEIQGQKTNFLQCSSAANRLSNSFQELSSTSNE